MQVLEEAFDCGTNHCRACLVAGHIQFKRLLLHYLVRFLLLSLGLRDFYNLLNVREIVR